MDKTVSSRLASLFEKGEIDVFSYFKQCAVLGVSFMAALGAINSTQAWASVPVSIQERAVSGYEGFVSADLLSAAVPAAAEPQEPSTGTPKVPYTKFIKAYEKFVKIDDTKIPD